MTVTVAMLACTGTLKCAGKLTHPLQWCFMGSLWG